MPFFRRADYRSDVTQFLDTLKSERPGLEARQRAGRSLLWDKNVDLDAWRLWRKNGVPQKPYVYQTDNPQAPAARPPTLLP